MKVIKLLLEILCITLAIALMLSENEGDVFYATFFIFGAIYFMVSRWMNMIVATLQEGNRGVEVESDPMSRALTMGELEAMAENQAQRIMNRKHGVRGWERNLNG